MHADDVLREAGAEIDRLRADLAEWKRQARRWEERAKKNAALLREAGIE